MGEIFLIVLAFWLGWVAGRSRGANEAALAKARERGYAGSCAAAWDYVVKLEQSGPHWHHVWIPQTDCKHDDEFFLPVHGQS